MTEVPSAAAIERIIDAEGVPLLSPSFPIRAQRTWSCCMASAAGGNPGGPSSTRWRIDFISFRSISVGTATLAGPNGAISSKIMPLTWTCSSIARAGRAAHSRTFAGGPDRTHLGD